MCHSKIKFNGKNELCPAQLPHSEKYSYLYFYQQDKSPWKNIKKYLTNLEG